MSRSGPTRNTWPESPPAVGVSVGDAAATRSTAHRAQGCHAARRRSNSAAGGDEANHEQEDEEVRASSPHRSAPPCWPCALPCGPCGSTMTTTRAAARSRTGRRSAPSGRSSTQTRPPCRRTCSSTSARPRPTPSLPRRPRRAAGEALEDQVALLGGTPGPLSSTAICTCHRRHGP